jgi:hypothetical protein
MTPNEEKKRDAVVSELQQRRAVSQAFHYQKESVSYISFGFTSAALGYWHTAKASEQTILLMIGLLLTIAANHLFMRDQLNRRWLASIQHHAFINAIKSLIDRDDPTLTSISAFRYRMDADLKYHSWRSWAKIIFPLAIYSYIERAEGATDFKVFTDALDKVFTDALDITLAAKPTPCKSLRNRPFSDIVISSASFIGWMSIPWIKPLNAFL